MTGAGQEMIVVADAPNQNQTFPGWHKVNAICAQFWNLYLA